jgi:hypothetical protein
MNVDYSKIMTHQQIYPDSCISSAVEMILKLNNKVDEDYYSLQVEQYRKLHIENNPDNEKYKSFNYLNGQEYYGLKFTNISEQPADELFQKIDEEINEGRYVIISLGNQNGGFHMWIIYGCDKVDGDYLNFSKRYCSTELICFNHLKAHARYMGKADILTYKSV